MASSIATVKMLSAFGARLGFEGVGDDELRRAIRNPALMEQIVKLMKTDQPSVKVGEGDDSSTRRLNIDGEPVEGLELTNETKGRLRRAAILTIYDLRSMTAEDLLCVWGIGEVTLEDVESTLDRLGLRLRHA